MSLPQIPETSRSYEQLVHEALDDLRYRARAGTARAADNPDIDPDTFASMQGRAETAERRGMASGAVLGAASPFAVLAAAEPSLLAHPATVGVLALGSMITGIFGLMTIGSYLAWGPGTTGGRVEREFKRLGGRRANLPPQGHAALEAFTAARTEILSLDPDAETTMQVDRAGSRMRELAVRLQELWRHDLANTAAGRDLAEEMLLLAAQAQALIPLLKERHLLALVPNHEELTTAVDFVAAASRTREENLEVRRVLAATTGTPIGAPALR